MEVQGYKSAGAVADEMRTLLEGSKRLGTFKGVTKDIDKDIQSKQRDSDLTSFTMAPQTIGLLYEATAVAYQAVRSEVQSEAILTKASCPLPPSPVLPPTLIQLGGALLNVAESSLSRSRLCLTGLLGESL